MTITRPPKGGLAVGAADQQPRPPAPRPTARPPAPNGSSRWTAGRITALAVGSILALVSLGLLGAGGTALWADRTQRDGGYATTDVHHFSTAASALATEPTNLGSSGVGWLYAPDILGKVRIRVTPTSPDRALFVGIGPSTDVDRYLGGVRHTVISDFWQDKVKAVEGSRPASAPATQKFWVGSATGPGAQNLVWDPTDGSWTVVVMNADARPGVSVGADLGAKLPALLWIAIGVLAAGAIFMAGGVLLIVGALSRRGIRPSD